MSTARRFVVGPMIAASAWISLGGCGEPSPRELKNRQEFEALLTAVALKNVKEVENDARRIEARHASGELSDARYDEIQAIIKKAREGRWDAAEKEAYQFREARPYFK
jgi:hypothetical protein